MPSPDDSAVPNAGLYQAIKYGIASTLAMILPLFIFWVGGWWMHQQLPVASQSPQSAYLFGVMSASLMAVWLMKILRTRVVWWYAYFESYLETQSYPTVGDVRE